MKALKPLKGSKIIYLKNGESQGEAFTDIYGGVYFPTVSIHKNATVSVNFGPNFKHPDVLQQFNAKGVSLDFETSVATFNVFFFLFRCMSALKI